MAFQAGKSKHGERRKRKVLNNRATQLTFCPAFFCGAIEELGKVNRTHVKEEKKLLIVDFE